MHAFCGEITRQPPAAEAFAICAPGSRGSRFTNQTCTYPVVFTCVVGHTTGGGQMINPPFVNCLSVTHDGHYIAAGLGNCSIACFSEQGTLDCARAHLWHCCLFVAFSPSLALQEPCMEWTCGLSYLLWGTWIDIFSSASLEPTMTMTASVMRWED